MDMTLSGRHEAFRGIEARIKLQSKLIAEKQVAEDVQLMGHDQVMARRRDYLRELFMQ